MSRPSLELGRFCTWNPYRPPSAPSASATLKNQWRRRSATSKVRGLQPDLPLAERKALDGSGLCCRPVLVDRSVQCDDHVVRGEFRGIDQSPQEWTARRQRCGTCTSALSKSPKARTGTPCSPSVCRGLRVDLESVSTGGSLRSRCGSDRRESLPDGLVMVPNLGPSAPVVGDQLESVIGFVLKVVGTNGLDVAFGRQRGSSAGP